MPRDTLERIIYQHVVYGAGTILTGQSTYRQARIQPDQLEAAVAQAKALFEAEDPQVSQPSESDGYDLQQGQSDLQQVLNLYNATVVDGRFIDDLATNPKAVAAKLNIELSETAAAAIEQARRNVAPLFARFVTVGGGTKIVVIVIVVGIAIRADETPYEIVVDSSGLVKV